MHRIFIGVHFDGVDEQQQDLLIGLLSASGFEGFEEETGRLSAYREADQFNKLEVDALVSGLGLDYTLTEIKELNWNARWEASFEPVVIPGAIAVRAAFHQPVAGVQQEIIITPKMSFGTGHHATTVLMMEAMLALDFTGKSVLDFGTGTGILAILAEKLGAAAVTAIDHDPWCIENATENLVANQCRRINVYQAADLPSGHSFDIILANINKSVILSNSIPLATGINAAGHLLLSGLLIEDRQDIEEAFRTLPVRLLSCHTQNNWILLSFAAKEAQ